MKKIIAIIKELYLLRSVLLEAKRLQNDNCVPLIIRYSIQQQYERYSFLIGKLKQQGYRLCKKLLFLFVLVFLFLSAVKLSAQQYLVTETELQQLEMLYRSSQENRRKAESELKELQPLLNRQKKIIQTLQTESMQLSMDLKSERQTVSDLTNCVSTLETEITTERNKAAQTRQELNDEKLAHEKTKNQRNILFFTLAFIVLAAVATVIVKVLIRFYKPF